MKAIDLWHDELRKLGITKKQLEDGSQFADQTYPDVGRLMREEVPEHLIPLMKKYFANMAKDLHGEILRKRQ